MVERRPGWFAAMARERRPLLGMVADSGLVARWGAESGADLLLALSAGVFRRQGLSALAPFLPFANANDLTEELILRDLAGLADTVAIVAGIFALDPTESHADRLGRWKRAGVAGIVNYPSVTLIDGSLRSIYEDSGATVEAEIALLETAKEHGLAAIGFIGNDPEAARSFAAAGIDGLILSTGITRQVADVLEHRDRLQEAVRALNAVRDAVRRRNPDLPCLIYGGPITRPEDLEQVYRQVSVDGFVGGSSFGRFPIEDAVRATIRRFRGVRSRSEDEATGLGPMIGATPAMRTLFELIRRAAACDLNICIAGESGVGKELVATHLHGLSARARSAFVPLNCGAIPDGLLESELFGHERGAFTGADHRRAGKFETAHGGTLFLDEIGDLSPRGQVALLRAIQQREVTRVGGDRPTPVNVRIVAASNRPLAELVEEGTFRADLYYRLNNLTIRVPPLRERLDDLALLIPPILDGLCVQMNRERFDLALGFLEKLRRHSWPGNLRELQHVLAQSALLEDGPILTGRDFSPDDRPASTAPKLADRVEREVREDRRGRIERALVEARGNKSRAAEILGVSRKTLYAWLDGLDTPR